MRWGPGWVQCVGVHSICTPSPWSCSGRLGDTGPPNLQAMEGTQDISRPTPFLRDEQRDLLEVSSQRGSFPGWVIWMGASFSVLPEEDGKGVVSFEMRQREFL